jgi:hypothetical protein
MQVWRKKENDEFKDGHYDALNNISNQDDIAVTVE